MIGCMVQCARECVVHVLFGTHAPSAWLHWIICLRCFSVCFCLVKMSVYVKTQRHVEASNRGEKIDTQRFAVPCFREQPQRFFFFIHEIASSQWFIGSFGLVIFEHVWIVFRELMLMIPYLSLFLTQTRLWLLLLFSSPVVFYMLVPCSRWNLTKEKKKMLCHLYCQFNHKNEWRVYGQWRRAANSEPPTHK